MFKAQFGRAEYSDIAFSITTRVDNSQAYGIVEEWTKKKIIGGGRVIEVWSSLQAHRGVNREGICPTIGTTDFSLPRIVIEYEDNEF